MRLLGLAAVALDGDDASEIGSHSLRIGGATAMYHNSGDLERVRRYGRWSSGVFHSYLWEGHEHTQGVSSDMAHDKMKTLEKRVDVSSGRRSVA